MKNSNKKFLILLISFLFVLGIFSMPDINRLVYSVESPPPLDPPTTPPSDPCEDYEPSPSLRSKCVGSDWYTYRCNTFGSSCDYTYTYCDFTYCCTIWDIEEDSPRCYTFPPPDYTPAENPDYPDSACGLDVALVLDNSDSISIENLTLMKQAFNLFVDAFRGTPTIFSVTRFDTTASVLQYFTNDTVQVKDVINSIERGENTNWEDALVKTASTFWDDGGDRYPAGVEFGRDEYFNLVIFSSDGNPNSYGSTGRWSVDRAIKNAILEANDIKEKDTRMFVLGIGDALDVINMTKISGPNVDPLNFLQADVVTTSFATLAEDLEAFARSSCGGTISINKYLETYDVDTKGGAGWGYTISGPETKTVSTNSDGSVNSGFLEEGTYSVVESTISEQYFLHDAKCTKNGDPIGTYDKDINGVSGITITDEDIVSCDFLNKEEPPNIKPEVLSIEINREYPDEVKGFSSTDHTGQELNNRVRVDEISAKTEVTAEFKDEDGLDQLRALSVWWSTSGTKNFKTPTKLGDTIDEQKTLDNGNFGIMVKKDIANGVWDEVYVPSYQDENNYYWVRANVEGEGDLSQKKYFVAGKNGEDIVEITNLTVTEEADKLVMNYLIRFLDSDEEERKVDTDNYHLWGSVYDQYGFVNIGGSVIVDSGDEYWFTNPSWIWNIDLIDPLLEVFTLSPGDAENSIKISIKVTDNSDGMKLSHVRLDACIDGADEPVDLEASGVTYSLLPCNDSFSNRIDYSPDNVNNSLLGNTGIAGGSIYSREGLNQVEVELQDNDEGTLYFYLTAMDYAGNYAGNFEYSELGVEIPPPIQFYLDDWVLVEDGLVFGEEGTNSTRGMSVDDIDWDEQSLDIFEQSKADLTNHVLLGGDGIGVNRLVELIKYSENLSFKASNFTGIYDSSTVNDLITAYEVKSGNNKFGEKEFNNPNNTISDSLLDSGSGGCDESQHDYCTLISNGNLTISGPSTFECDHKGLIIVDGDLNINTYFENDQSEDACIILVSGRVTINVNKNTPNDVVNYNIIETFIIAGEDIVIEDNSEIDGLYVEGGLVALEPKTDNRGIYNNRSLEKFKRQYYPVIAVKCRSKYGLLARKLFGTPVDVFKSEVGFKPY